MSDESDGLTRRERLERLRDGLAEAIAGAESRELPALAREYRATLAELEALPPEQGRVTKRDQLAEQRRRRAGVAQ